ncbi:MAG: response regulator transcription factor [Kiritimatiellae bacterium]|nr:response regulator transcription factor [Kiritimatiellia bacterium]
MKKTRILIADDHTLMRVGIKAMFHYQPDMTVVGEATSGEEAVALAGKLKPDVIIMDLMMPVLGGAEATKRILESDPDAKIIILTSFGAATDMVRALKYGALGAQVKEAPTEALIAAIHAVTSGGTAISPEVKKMTDMDADIPVLTERQQGILESAVRGLTNKEISVQFGLSPLSVKKYLSIIFAKIGAANRTEAASIALRRHLLDA